MQSTVTTAWAVKLLVVLMRLAGIFAVGPVLSHTAVPARVRYFMAVVMSLAVMGRISVPSAVPAGWGRLLAGLGGELLIGAAIGWAAALVFVGVELGAVHVGRQMGVSLGEVFDPVSPAAPRGVRQFFRLLAVVVFLGVGGHRAMIGGLLETFRAVPLTGFARAPAAAETMISLLSVSFVLALKVAAPVLIALLLASAAMGLLQRSLPQCHILSMGLPIRALAALAILAVSLAAITGLVESGTTIVLERMGETIRPGQ